MARARPQPGDRETPRLEPEPRRRSLAPREHGAYAQLGFPMLAALGSGRPGWASCLLGLSAWALFFAAEPVQVLLGRRGARAREGEGARAGRWLVLLGAAAAVLGALGLLAGGPAVRWAVLVPAFLGAAFSTLLWLGRERTSVGEVLAAWTLSSVAFPVALGGGVSPLEAARALLVWTLGLTALVFPVRAIGARRRARTSPLARVLPALGVAALAVGLLWRLFLPLDLVALAPLLLASVSLGAAPPEPRKLRRVGWNLVVAMLFTAGLLVLEARGGTVQWTALQRAARVEGGPGRGASRGVVASAEAVSSGVGRRKGVV